MTSLTLLQVATGVFFTTTGYRKLFTAEGRGNVEAVFHRIRKPWALWPTMLGEFAGGIALMTGVLPRVAAAGLLLIMLGAYTLVVFPPIWQKDRNAGWSKLLSNALCTPEAQLILILTTLVIGG